MYRKLEAQSLLLSFLKNHMAHLFCIGKKTYDFEHYDPSVDYKITTPITRTALGYISFGGVKPELYLEWMFQHHVFRRYGEVFVGGQRLGHGIGTIIDAILLFALFRN